MKRSPFHVLLINPWITDFAAYNFWVRPLGLLRIGSSLRRNGVRITLIDCLDAIENRKQYDTGKFFKARINKPFPLKYIPRYYSRYGMSERMFRDKLSAIGRADLVAITSGMTYWYPGLFDTIKITRSVFRDIPIVLGGIYATLCYDHAVRLSCADHIIRGHGESELLNIIQNLSSLDVASVVELRAPNSEFRTDHPPYPCFNEYPELSSVCISTSSGCPFQCPYCASRILDKAFVRRDPTAVVEEIEYWTKAFRVRNIAFYDDALLMEPHEHAVPMMKEIIKRRIQCNFHAPNGLHVRGIDDEIAELLFRSGFKTIRLGYETSDVEQQVKNGGKVNNLEFYNTLKSLYKYGYSKYQIGVYILVGLPGQRVEEAEQTIAYVKEAGGRPILTEYSPVPGTSLFEEAKRSSRFDIEKEPLYQNNSILPCQWEGFTVADYRRLKLKAREEWSDDPA